MYLSSMDPFFPMALDIGLEGAKNAIRRIETAGLSAAPLPKFTDFYPILYLQSNPQDLRVVNNTRIVSGCVGLLRRYTEDIKESGKGLLSHSFGFYCFRTMLIGTQVGILAQNNALDTFIETHGHITRPDQVSYALSRTVDELVMQNWRQHMSLLRPLGPKILPMGERMLLGSVGGLLNTDVGFLLEALWKDRDVLTYITTHYPTHGWGIFLLLLGQHAIWALDLDSNDDYKWGHLRALCFRYSLAAARTENAYLQIICYDLRDLGCNGQEECLSFLVDQADAQSFLEVYISRIKPSPNQSAYPIEILELFSDFLPQEDMLKPAYLMPPLVEALYSRIWQECGHSDLSTRWAFAAYCTGVFKTTSKMFQLHSDRAIIEILHLSDLIELIGRVVLSPLGYGSFLIFHLLQGDDTDPNITNSLKYGNELLQSLLILASSLPREAQEGFLNCNQEWKKIWRHLLAYPAYYLPDEMAKYLYKCRLVWSTLGFAFGYTSPGAMEQGRQCAYL
ncbi:hypothetical protein FRC08_007088 [Ceratobasidium sp. 394]|nr:hypothetical protein FRC08_007088 [Ceratobasidium sp. 394]